MKNSDRVIRVIHLRSDRNQLERNQQHFSQLLVLVTRNTTRKRQSSFGYQHKTLRSKATGGNGIAKWIQETYKNKKIIKHCVGFIGNVILILI